VLPILFESATRWLVRAEAAAYVADIHFGSVTATDDAEAEREPVAIRAPGCARRARRPVGVYHASCRSRPVLGGQGRRERAYKLCRRGEEPRPALGGRGDEALLLDFTPGKDAVARESRSGAEAAYLRSIACDIGKHLGSAVSRPLVRTAYGGSPSKPRPTQPTWTTAEEVRR